MLGPHTPSTAPSPHLSLPITSSGISTTSRSQSSQAGRWSLWWGGGRVGAPSDWRVSVWPSQADGSVGPVTVRSNISPWLFWTVSVLHLPLSPPLPGWSNLSSKLQEKQFPLFFPLNRLTMFVCIIVNLRDSWEFLYFLPFLSYLFL